MFSFKYFIKFTLTISILATSAFADFYIDVEHPTITTIAVQRNVITLFERDSGIDIQAINLPSSEFIRANDRDHREINHHGHGFDGEYVSHYHITLREIHVVTPQTLERILRQLDFELDVLGQIMRADLGYFTENAQEMRSLTPFQTNKSAGVTDDDSNTSSSDTSSFDDSEMSSDESDSSEDNRLPKFLPFHIPAGLVSFVLFIYKPTSD